MKATDSLPVFGSGRVYTFVDLFRIAWRQSRAHWLRALAFAAMLAGAQSLLFLCFGYIVRAFESFLVNISSVVPPLRNLQGYKVSWPAAVLVAWSISYMFMAMYYWAAVRSFDGPPMAWRHLWRPWRMPGRGALCLLAFLFAAVLLTRHFGISYLIRYLFPMMHAGGEAWLIHYLVYIHYLSRFIVRAALWALTLTAWPTILTWPAPRLGRSLRIHLRVLKGRPRHTLLLALMLAAIAAVPDAVKALEALFARLSGGFVGIHSIREPGWFLLNFATWTALLLSLFAVAAFYRSVFTPTMKPD